MGLTRRGGSIGGGSVVVTGAGWVTPLGGEREATWQALLGGAVGLQRLRRLDASALPADRGGEVDLDCEGDRLAACYGGSRAALMASVASRRAYEDAGIGSAGVERERIGVVFGSVMATRPTVEPRGAWSPAGAPRSRRAALNPPSTPASISRAPARELDLRGPNRLLSTACASGNSAIALAAELLRDGQADAMVAGGADEISYAMLLMFNSFRSLAPDAVRPFDLNRRGLMLAEGAAALLLERESDARARGARVYGRVAGHATVAEAHHMTAPDPSGAGAARAIAGVLREADAAPGDVDHISAHGTGTASNDSAEAAAIRRVFGAHADRVPVASLKGAIGHAQGAASAIEAIACLLSLRDGVIPPTANHETPDPACPLDVVAGSARRGRLRLVLNNAFGFGGNVECLAFAST